MVTASAAMIIGLWSATDFKFSATFVPTVGFGVGLAAFLVGLVVAFVFYVFATWHLRKTFNTLAQKSGEASFTTAATLMWWGAVLSIVLVGFVLIFVAWIFATLGFFTMKPYEQQPYTPMQNAYGPSAQFTQGKVIQTKQINQNTTQ